MWPIADARTQPKSWRGVARWFRAHPGLALAVLTGFLAFFRLLAVSHGRLRTARVLLDRADPTVLAGGLALSAALLWLPAVFALATYAFLSVQRSSGQLAQRIGVGGMLLAVVGTFALWDQLDLQYEDVAEAGPSFVAIAATIGIGVGCLLHFVLRFATQGRAGSTPTGPPASSGPSTTEEPPATQEPSATVDAPTTPAEPATSEPPAAPELDDSDDGGAGRPQPTPGSAPRPLRRVGRYVEATLGGLFGLAGLLFVLAMVVFVLLGLWIMLSEPSQPPENVTVTIDGRSETRTVHVIDDGGGEVVMMAADNRIVLTADPMTIDDRYICDTAKISRTHNRAVTAAVEDRTLDAALTEIVELGEGDDVHADLAREWVDAVVATPPPCSPEWTAGELDQVRTALGYACHELTGCVRRDR